MLCKSYTGSCREQFGKEDGMKTRLMRRMKAAVVVLVLSALSGFAELKIPGVFSDNMVLQRGQKVAVWGWAEPGEQITVVFAGERLSGKAGRDGRFMVYLPALDASAEPRVLRFKTAGGDSAEIKNVLIGEVWLCSGQSNMQMTVSGAKDFPKEQKEAAGYPQIRMFLTDAKTSRQPQPDCGGAWKVCAPQNVGKFSATAYFFGRKLHQELGVPVGLIRSSWGGTGIEAWSPMNSLKKYPSVMAYKAAMDHKAKSYDAAAAEKKFRKQLYVWTARARQAKDAGRKPPRRPRKAVHPHNDQNYPANLYNAMIHPLVPYGIRGAIWYQGEHNSHTFERAVLYRDLLENLILQWRADWSADLPFYAVQLVNFRAPQVEPVEDTGWAIIRESFLKFHKEVPNAGIAIGIDVGDADDIHPKDKQTIGVRLAHQALAKTYGKKVVAGGPIYKDMQIQDGQIALSFDDIGSGLMAQDGDLKRFAIAGADKKFVNARAVIQDDKVVVSSPVVPKPVAVRYAWANNPEGCNLYNKEGFAASPFRTDDWPFVAP